MHAVWFIVCTIMKEWEIQVYLFIYIHADSRKHHNCSKLVLISLCPYSTLKVTCFSIFIWYIESLFASLSWKYARTNIKRSAIIYLVVCRCFWSANFRVCYLYNISFSYHFHISSHKLKFCNDINMPKCLFNETITFAIFLLVGVKLS